VTLFFFKGKTVAPKDLLQCKKDYADEVRSALDGLEPLLQEARAYLLEEGKKCKGKYERCVLEEAILCVPELLRFGGNAYSVSVSVGRESF